MGWRCGSNGRWSACFASTKPHVQIPVPLKQTKITLAEKNVTLCKGLFRPTGKIQGYYEDT
jgi:hypothetical protein